MKLCWNFPKLFWKQTRMGIWKPSHPSPSAVCCSARALSSHPIPLRPHNTSRIPNGFYVSYVSKPDVDFLFREIYEEKVYMQHGIHLLQGDTVVDVGANIGMFAMYCSESVGPTIWAEYYKVPPSPAGRQRQRAFHNLGRLQGRVICAEPIPKIFSVLEDNLQRHQDWCAERGLVASSPVALNTGVGRAEGTLEFTFYSSAAGWSTMYEDNEEVREAMGVYLSHAVGSGKGLVPSVAANLGRACQRWAPKGLWDLLWRGYVGWMLRQRHHISCPVTTVSRIMEMEGLAHIDLLKIDVERAELDVLEGLSPEELNRVRQVVVEAHEGHGQLSAVLDLLRSAGFEFCHVAQDDQLAGSTIYTVYARRNDVKHPEKGVVSSTNSDLVFRGRGSA